MFITRNITLEILDALSTSPVTLLNGARQTGKSTLAKWIAEQQNYEYSTLDDFTILDIVSRDPVGYLKAFKRPIIIDEVQKAPQLFPAIKQIVDEKRLPGKFFLTGSANILILPKLSESLVGRMEIVTLWPFACDELIGRKGKLIDSLFADDFEMIQDNHFSREELIEKIINGGYPEIQTLPNERRKEAWFNSYLTTILQRDIRDISQIEGLQELPRLLRLIAAQAGSLVNISSLSRDAGLVMMTLKRYLSLLEATFLVRRLPAWFQNISKRLVKAPKIYLNDTGLFCFLAGITHERISREPQILGHILENFVMQELFKQATWSQIRPQIYYYRTTAGKEIDFILENRAGEIVGIEVKATATVKMDDFNGILELKEVLGKKFIRGIVLYTGTKTVPFGDRMYAVPISSLWQMAQLQNE